eukprot:scaffold313216_cov33-Tisochrysis_lutea.AAC.1
MNDGVEGSIHPEEYEWYDGSGDARRVAVSHARGGAHGLLWSCASRGAVKVYPRYLLRQSKSKPDLTVEKNNLLVYSPLATRAALLSPLP